MTLQYELICKNIYNVVQSLSEVLVWNKDEGRKKETKITKDRRKNTCYSRRRWDDNTKMYVNDIEWVCVNWFELEKLHDYQLFQKHSAPYS
jgi:hypothetical protein